LPGKPDGAKKTKNEIVLLSAALKKMLDRLTEIQALELREQALVADNEVLDRLNLMKTEFFQNMSHDLKTPLTVVSVNVLDTLDMLDFEISTEDIRENLNAAQREIMRMARMVDSAMKQSSLYDGRQDMKPIDIGSLLRESAETYRALLDRNGNTLTLDVAQPLPRVFGNADMLLHVLSNLLANANRYTRQGEITVQATLGDGVVDMRVRDNGTGILSELLPHVFERGVSENRTGLGLAICKTAIEAHGGTISIESTYGQGTEVAFSLPVYRP